MSFWSVLIIYHFDPSGNPWHGKCRWTPKSRLSWLSWLLLSGNSASLPRFRKACICPPGKTWNFMKLRPLGELTASELSPNQSWSFRPCSWWPKLNPKAKATNSVFWDCLEGTMDLQWLYSDGWRIMFFRLIIGHIKNPNGPQRNSSGSSHNIPAVQWPWWISKASTWTT